MWREGEQGRYRPHHHCQHQVGRQSRLGGEFRDAIQSIRQKITYNKVHDATTCAEIMKLLAAADEALDIGKAKSPSGMANAIEEGLN